MFMLEMFLLVRIILKNSWQLEGITRTGFLTGFPETIDSLIRQAAQHKYTILWRQQQFAYFN